MIFPVEKLADFCQLKSIPYNLESFRSLAHKKLLQSFCAKLIKESRIVQLHCSRFKILAGLSAWVLRFNIR